MKNQEFVGRDLRETGYLSLPPHSFSHTRFHESFSIVYCMQRAANRVELVRTLV